MAKEPKSDDIMNSGDDMKAALEDLAWDEGSSEKGKEKSSANGRPGESTEKRQGGAKKAPEFSELKRSGVVSTPSNLDFILDIPLQVTVELGRTTMPIYDLLQLGQGSIIELNKMAGEPLEILVNQKLIAKGEVVVVNEKFGIRLTDVVSPIERIEKLS